MRISGSLRPLALLLLALLPARSVAAQNPALVEALAPLLMAEDRRQLDVVAMSRALTHPEPLVRRTAVVAIGRIGDRRALPLVLESLGDRDLGVVADAFFAIGLLGDSSATPALLTRLAGPDSLDVASLQEATVALARLADAAAVAALSDLIAGRSALPRERRDAMLPSALLEVWRLGARAPVIAMIPYLSDRDDDLRWRASYALARLRAKEAGQELLRAARDPHPLVRENVMKALTRAYADSAGLPHAAVSSEAARGLQDRAPGVKINALQSIVTWRDSTHVNAIIRLLSDADYNVRVQATLALGSYRNASAIAALDGVLDRRDALWAMRRSALGALALADTAKFAARAASWSASTDVREQIAALEAWGTVTGAGAERFEGALASANARVQAAALVAWRASAPRGDSAVLAAARLRLRHSAPEIRSVAATVVGASATLDDLDPLLVAWRLGAGDPDRSAQQAVLGTLSSLARRAPELMERLADPARRDFLVPPTDPALRRRASSWPALAERWGDPGPAQGDRSLEDYRVIVRTLVLARDNPRVRVDLDGRGTIEVELLGRDAPLTVANFLRLVDRHWYDGASWHRVVPNFVVQTGERVGGGEGPGWTIRAEVNRRRYDVPMLGMADSGLDTAGSQWFINLSPQPHLDGRYTIFGKVIGSYNALQRVTQGDLIRTIQR